MGKILIIAEKPSQASNIADALGLKDTMEWIKVQNDDIKLEYHSGTYQENNIVLISMKGHLLELRGRSSDIIYFNFTWKKPTKRNKDKYARYLAISKIIKKQNEVIIATDSDDEGELIGYNILKHFDCFDISSRMLFVSMTENAIRRAFEQRTEIRINIALSSELRTWMDKTFGYIFSKYLTTAYCQVTGSTYIQLPVGRVMTPALSYIIENLYEIERVNARLKDYKPKYVYNFELKYFIPTVDYLENDVNIPDYNRQIDLEEAEELLGKYQKCYGVIEKIWIKELSIPASSSGLTIDDVREYCYDKKGIGYKRTDAILEALYIDKLISYPRTESRILPDDAEYHEAILENCLSYLDIDNDNIERDIPYFDDDDDGSHFGIHPTEESPESKLPLDFQIVYNYIVKRYVQGFCHDWIMEKYKALLHVFDKDGNRLPDLDTKIKYHSKTTDYGFKLIEDPHYNHLDMEEDIIPDVYAGMGVSITPKVERRILTLNIPDRFKKSDLFKYMKKNNLGTDATRSLILEKLWEVNLLREDPAFATILGIRVYEAIKDINEELTKVELTDKFNRYMEDVKNGVSTIEEKKEIVKNEITELIEDRLDDMEEIGNELAFFGECKECHSKMKLVSWKKNDSFLFFLACSNDDCNMTSSI